MLLFNGGHPQWRRRRGAGALVIPFISLCISAAPPPLQALHLSVRNLRIALLPSVLPQRESPTLAAHLLSWQAPGMAQGKTNPSAQMRAAFGNAALARAGAAARAAAGIGIVALLLMALLYATMGPPAASRHDDGGGGGGHEEWRKPGFCGRMDCPEVLDFCWRKGDARRDADGIQQPQPRETRSTCPPAPPWHRSTPSGRRAGTFSTVSTGQVRRMRFSS